MTKICEQNENDIRSCLNALEFLARRRANNSKFTPSTSKEIFSMQKDHSRGFFDLINDLLRVEKINSNYMKFTDTNIKKFKSYFI